MGKGKSEGQAWQEEDRQEVSRVGEVKEVEEEEEGKGGWVRRAYKRPRPDKS